MTLRLAVQGVRSRIPAAALARGVRAGSTTPSGKSPSNKGPTTDAIKDNPNNHETNPKNTPPESEIPSKKTGHDQWLASLASSSEETVKADRTGDDFKDFKDLQEKSKRVAEDKNSTSNLTDSLWRSVGGGK